MNNIDSAIEHRKKIIAATRRVVIKVGTRLLTGIEDASEENRIEALIREVHHLRQRGVEVVLVSSGAIGAGMKELGITQRPVQLPRLQALASIGQLRLMAFYQKAAAEYGFHCAQVLLCADDVQDRQRHLNTASCIDTLLKAKALPIVNENDSVSVDEIKFGDNDRLAAMVAMLTRADLAVFLTSIDGLHVNKNGKWGERISLVREFDREIREMAVDTSDRNTSTGGMMSKLEAAEKLARAGEPAWVADGTDFGVFERIFAGENVGTLFLPAETDRMPSRKRFLAFFSEPTGAVEIDDGAKKALKSRSGKSLLPRGVIGCHGIFLRGDTVKIMDSRGEEIGRGVCNYSSDELEKIKGRHSREINDILGYTAYDCVIHRDYLVVTGQSAGQGARQGSGQGEHKIKSRPFRMGSG